MVRFKEESKMTMILKPMDTAPAIVAGLIVGLLTVIACFLYRINDHLYHLRWGGRDASMQAAASPKMGKQNFRPE
jgi:hypothetical protein